MRWSMSAFAADVAVADGADAGDPALDRLAWLQEAGRLAGEADTSRRAGEDDVARQQRHDGRQLGYQAGDVEDQVAGAGVLHRLSVDGAAQRQVVGIVELVGRDQPRADRAVARVRLAQA